MMGSKYHVAPSPSTSGRNSSELPSTRSAFGSGELSLSFNASSRCRAEVLSQDPGIVYQGYRHKRVLMIRGSVEDLGCNGPDKVHQVYYSGVLVYDGAPDVPWCVKGPS
ncbi:hypothetical protein Trydic_g10843 [Trypoxylus dichotomus]